MKRRTLILITASTLLAGSATLAMAGPHGDWLFGPDRIDAHVQRLADRLELSEGQQAQIRTILEEAQVQRDLERQQTRAAIDAVLTDEQRATQDSRTEARIDRHVARLTDRIDLSTEQQAQVRALLAERRNDPGITPAEMRERMATILDDEQQAQLADLRESHGKGGRRDGAGRDCQR